MKVLTCLDVTTKKIAFNFGRGTKKSRGEEL